MKKFLIPSRWSCASVMLATIAILSGCATFSRDGGLDDVSALTRGRTGAAVSRGTSPAVRDQVDQWLSQPLTPDTAVRIALANSPRLQASLSDLGVAEAERVEAGRLSNPGFSFSRLRSGGDVEIERSVGIDLLGLVTLPFRSRIGREQFEQAKIQAAIDAVKLAADTRRAYFNAIASTQSVDYMTRVKVSAEAGAQLAQEMARVGNVSQLEAARQQAFYADTVAQLARARQDAATAREALSRLLGVWGDKKNFTLPERLPELPAVPEEPKDIETTALSQRLDVQLARRELDSLGRSLGLTRSTAFINVLEGGYVNKSETGNARANGYEVSLEIPLFDWSSRPRKAQAMYDAATHRMADTAIRARSEAHQTYLAYRTAYDLARHYRTEIVPLRKKISDEIALRYNGMHASVFELLADAREQANSVNAAIEAERNFWLAQTDLQMAISGAGGATASTKSSAPAANGEAARH